NPAPLTVTASNRTKIYGDQVTFAGTEFTQIGLVLGDAIDSVALHSSGAAVTVGVGTYDITASAGGGTGLGNYSISYTVGHLTVAARPATVVADAKSRFYGAANPALT